MTSGQSDYIQVIFEFVDLVYFQTWIDQIFFYRKGFEVLNKQLQKIKHIIMKLLLNIIWQLLIGLCKQWNVSWWTIELTLFR